MKMKIFNVYLLEMKQFLYSVRTKILLFILVPFIIAYFNGVLYKSVIDPNRTIPKFEISIIDMDKGLYSSTLKDILGSQQLETLLTIKSEEDLDDVKTALKKEKSTVAIFIPEGFTADIKSNKPATIEVLKSPSSGISGEITENIVVAYTKGLNTNLGVFNLMISNVKDPQLAERLYSELVPEIAAIASNNYLTAETLEKTRTINAKEYYPFSMLSAFSLFICLAGASSIIKERENSTLLRLGSTSTTKFSFLGGKLLAILSFSLLQIVAFILLTKFVLGINPGTNILATCLVIFAHGFCITGLAILLVGIFKTNNSMNSSIPFVLMIMSVLGGAFFPTGSYQGIMKIIAKLTVNYWLEDSYTQLILGTPTSEILQSIFVLLSIGLAGITIGSIFFKFDKSEVL